MHTDERERERERETLLENSVQNGDTHHTHSTCTRHSRSLTGTTIMVYRLEGIERKAEP